MKMYRTVSDLPSPCFLVDLKKVKRNCDAMINRCKELQVQLRPHTKTHKTVEAAILQTNGTKTCIAVSTLAEAEFYTHSGFDDILLAYPITENKIKRCLVLLKKLEKFHVMVSGNEGLQCLQEHAKDLPEGKKWSVVVEVDLGYGRTGYPWDSEELLNTVKAVVSSPVMRLEQLYAHCGNSYAVSSIKEREEFQTLNIDRLQEIQKKLGFTCALGVGSTPTCSLPVKENKLLSEFHPGNYVFYDYMQLLIGSCSQSNIACRVMTRVIAHKQEKNMLLIDCGFTALGHDGKKERLPLLDFCLIQDESNLKLFDMSQEIGKVIAKEGELDCKLYPVGTILYIIPYHSCCTSSQHAKYHVHEGDVIVETWKPVRGW